MGRGAQSRACRAGYAGSVHAASGRFRGADFGSGEKRENRRGGNRRAGAEGDRSRRKSGTGRGKTQGDHDGGRTSRNGCENRERGDCSSEKRRKRITSRRQCGKRRAKQIFRARRTFGKAFYFGWGLGRSADGVRSESAARTYCGKNGRGNEIPQFLQLGAELARYIRRRIRSGRNDSARRARSFRGIGSARSLFASPYAGTGRYDSSRGGICEKNGGDRVCGQRGGYESLDRRGGRRGVFRLCGRGGERGPFRSFVRQGEFRRKTYGNVPAVPRRYV